MEEVEVMDSAAETEEFQTVSGGDAIYQYYEYYCVADEDLLEAVDAQTVAIQEGFSSQTAAIQEGLTAVCLLLGLIAGMIFMLGFWMSRRD